TIKSNLTRENDFMKESVKTLSDQMKKYENYSDIMLSVKKEISKLGLQLLQKDAAMEDMQKNTPGSMAKVVKKHSNKAENKIKVPARTPPHKVPKDKTIKKKKPVTKAKLVTLPKVPQPTIKTKPGIRQPGIVKSVTYYKAGRLEEMGNSGKSKFKQSSLYFHTPYFVLEIV
ncbi:olfactomedin-like protein 2A, partial [Rhincodon typus]|uniref:olfactomedin-like protein 2A n=1 Tax=Rhincodon typus TaxID=259920 RepID=UPI00202E1963